MSPLFALVSVSVSAAASPAITTPTVTTPAAHDGLHAAAGDILQARGDRAKAVLSALPAGELDDKDRRFQACALSRLDEAPPATPVIAPATGAPDAVATRALQLYRAYWRTSLAGPDRRDTAEQALLKGLADLLGEPFLADMDDAETALARRLLAAGLHSQEGKTGQLRDLMVWRSQKERTWRVALPEGANLTRVVYLDDFVSRGWSNYFTCDRTGTGGWTGPDGLYVVVPSYDSLTDENFRVNFLAHESQHYSDNRRFPHLLQWELEYRAKLVELAYADLTMQHVLDSFASNQGDDPSDAHSYADRKLLRDLRARLGLQPGAALNAAPTPQIQAAAVAILKEDSARRAARPADRHGDASHREE